MATILVVEDEVLIQMLVVEYLGELGFEVEIAGTADDATIRMRRLGGAVDAAIVDVGLPDAPDGELVDTLRAAYPALPIVVASGHSQVALRKRFEAHARIGFLSKPYSVGDLGGALGAIGIAG